MSIRDEMDRQKKAEKEQSKNSDAKKKRLESLIESLESRREPEFRQFGNFAYEPSEEAWIVRFPSLWSQDDPRRTNRLPAITNMDSPWHDADYHDGQKKTQKPTQRETHTGLYKIELTDDDKIQIMVHRLYAEEPVPKSLRTWERFDKIGIYDDEKAALENFFPIYAREVGGAQGNKRENEELGAKIDKWMEGRAKAHKEANNATFAEIFGDAFDASRNNTVFQCPKCSQNNRLQNAPNAGSIEVVCGRCSTPFLIKDGVPQPVKPKSNILQKMYGFVMMLLGLSAIGFLTFLFMNEL